VAGRFLTMVDPTLILSAYVEIEGAGRAQILRFRGID